MPDDKVVKDEVVEPTPSPEVKPEDKPKDEPKEEPQPQPLTEERVQQMLSEQGETLKRSLQSEKDKAVAEVRREADRRVRYAEDKTATYAKSFSNLDPEVAKEVELEQSRVERRINQEREAEENAKRQFRETYDAFNANMNQFVTDMGVDPKDINWGDESEPLLQKQQRILGEVGKVQKVKEKELKDSIPRLVKEEVARERQAQGLDSVPTDTSGGVSGSDADFLDKFGKGEIPASKENVERAKKLTE